MLDDEGTPDGMPVIGWEYECDLTAADLGVKPGRSDGGELEKACDLLREMLAAGGQPKADIETAAVERNISAATLRRAFTTMRIESQRMVFQGKTWWHLPSDAQPSANGQS